MGLFFGGTTLPDLVKQLCHGVLLLVLYGEFVAPLSAVPLLFRKNVQEQSKRERDCCNPDGHSQRPRNIEGKLCHGVLLFVCYDLRIAQINPLPLRCHFDFVMPPMRDAVIVPPALHCGWVFVAQSFGHRGQAPKPINNGLNIFHIPYLRYSYINCK